jgi:hypothetical protein
LASTPSASRRQLPLARIVLTMSFAIPSSCTPTLAATARANPLQSFLLAGKHAAQAARMPLMSMACPQKKFFGREILAPDCCAGVQQIASSVPADQHTVNNGARG